jgi:hypothetical protein
MEADQIYLLAFAVLRHLQQIQYTQESGRARQLWSNVRKPDRLDRVHFDLTFFHLISVSDLDVRTRPDPDTAGDLATPHPIAKPPGKHHAESVRARGVG